MSAGACIVFASLNAVTLTIGGSNPFLVILEPAVLLILFMALAFYLSGVVNHWTMQALQVLVYLTGGVLTSSGAIVGDLTSLLFAIYGLYLFNEYGDPGKRLVPSALITATYLALTILLAEPSDTTSSIINHLAFSAAVVGLYGLVVYRQIEIRRRYSRHLETQVRERTHELQERTDELERTLAQRNALIQEIHHRIGNSLQLLASYISLQRPSEGSAESTVLRETELRIHAISDVHAKLYATQQFSHLPLSEYTIELLYDLEGAYATGATIQKEVLTVADAHIDFAIPFGIIINELVTNAIKHSASNQRNAEVHVSVKDGDGGVKATVRDVGGGFPIDFQPGIGTEVVDELVAQLDGTVQRSTDSGAIVDVWFPADAVTHDSSHTSQIVDQ